VKRQEQFQLEFVRQERIDRAELRQGPQSLMGLQLAKISKSQLEAALIQLRIHRGSPASGSNRDGHSAARDRGQIRI
jgi:hypothetical protein